MAATPTVETRVDEQRLRPTETEQMLRRLRIRRQELLDAVSTGLHGSGTDHRDEAGLPRRADDTDDDAAAETQRTADVHALSRLAEELSRVDAALARAAEGHYGECIDCGEAIEPARLQAFPAAARCTECQQLAERRQARPSRRPA